AVHAAAEAGYLTGTTCVRAAATPADDPLTLPRKAVSRGDDVFGVAWKLLTKNAPKVTPIRR
ncbi:MAG: polysaccharide deacetylase family protein, partial [Zoogloea sp.]|nr:polysaccharide deacetylase family protein [Zoogloea sp.]